MLQTASEQKNFIVLAFCTHYVGGADLNLVFCGLVHFFRAKKMKTAKYASSKKSCKRREYAQF
jgi:hypothetical protein